MRVTRPVLSACLLAACSSSSALSGGPSSDASTDGAASPSDASLDASFDTSLDTSLDTSPDAAASPAAVGAVSPSSPNAATCGAPLVWSPVAGSPAGIAISGSGPRDVWLIGAPAGPYVPSSGPILRGDGTTWSPAPGTAGDAAAAGDASALWVASPTEAFVASSEQLERWDGSSWTPYSVGHNRFITSFWGSGPDDVWGAGRVSSLWHWDGTSESAASDPFGLAGDARLAGGAPGDFWEYTAGTLEHHASAGSFDVVVTTASLGLGSDGGLPAASFYAGWASATSDVWFVGDRGLAIHFDGLAWHVQSAPTMAALRGVWGSSRTDVWAVGDGGVIVHFDGTQWTSVATPTSADLAGVWSSGPCDVWAIGDAVYHAAPASPGCSGGGACTFTCGAPFAPCSGACVDFTRDSQSCGGCGAANVCTGGTSCQGGQCVCPPTLRLRGGQCIDPSTVPPTAVSPGSDAGGQTLAIAVDATSVYWRTFDAIQKVPVTGGASVVLASFAPTLEGSFAIDATNAYWLSDGADDGGPLGDVMAVPLAGGTPRALAGGVNLGGAIATDGTSLYWSTTTAPLVADQEWIMTAPVGGGTPVKLASATATPAFAVNSSNVYWIDGTGGPLVTVPRTGGTPVTLVAAPVWAFVVDDAHLCWGDGSNLSCGPLAATPARVVAPSAAPAALDASNVYFTQFDGAPAFGNSVYEAPIAGGAPAALAHGQSGSGFLAVDATSVYWVNDGGEVMKAAK